jgi:hypothetical protein
MNENKITEILEGHDISEDKIAQIVSQFSEQPKSEKSTDVVANDLLDFQIRNEEDWRKKTSLIAKRISKSFDE